MKNGFSALLLIFFASSIEAAINPSELIKVDGNSKQNCVEYYNYKGSMYCSTKPLSTQRVDPEIKNYETQQIVFDDRAWQPVWGQKDNTGFTVEYVPIGDDINNWNELITSQFFPGLQTKVTPKEYADIVIKHMESSSYKPVIHVIKDDKDTYIFEFQIASPAAQIQDEIQKITLGDKGIYVLHYVIKKNDMGKKNRDLWVKNIMRSGSR